MKSDMKSYTTSPISSQEAERPRAQLLPPLVTLQGTSERCFAFMTKIIQFIAPEAIPASPSAIPDREIEECIAVSAIALSWHFAALSDPARRDQHMKALSENTFGLMVSTEAARAAIINGTTIGEEVTRIGQQLGGAQESGNERYEPATATLHPPAKNTSQSKVHPRRLPLVAIPRWVSTQCWKRVVELFGQFDAETRPGFLSAISDQEIEERAGACHLVMCWFLGALSTSDRGDQNALQWVEEVPRLVRVMMASGARPSIYGLRTKHRNSMRRRGRGCGRRTIFN